MSINNFFKLVLDVGVLDALRWKHIQHLPFNHYTQVHLRMRSEFPWIIRVLLWIGFVRIGVSEFPSDGWRSGIRWPFKAPPAWALKDWNHYCAWNNRGWFYILRNSPGVIKWLPGTLLPMRWGFVVCGFEFGQRG